MNWTSLLTALGNCGLTQQEIARHAGLAQTSVSDLLTGKTPDPRYTAGIRLRSLAEEKLGGEAVAAMENQPRASEAHAA